MQAAALDVGLGITQLAGNYLNSAEFQSRFGTLDNAGFVNLMYRNVLSRAADSGGFSVQIAALEQGVSRAQLLANFSESTENVGLTGAFVQDGLFLPGAELT